MLADLPPDVVDYYAMLKELPDGRVCGVQRLLFHWTLHVDIDDIGYADRYCYQTADGAFNALMQWNGEGDPEGWHRHPKSGRRRDLATGKEWIAP